MILLYLQNLHHVGPHFKAIYEESDNDNESRWICGLRPNLFVTQYLFWAFRSSFMAVLLSSAVWFFMLTAIFTLLIFIIGIRNPVCISVGGEDFGEDKGIWKKAMDAYALSWTTFSTVVCFFPLLWLFSFVSVVCSLTIVVFCFLGVRACTPSDFSYCECHRGLKPQYNKVHRDNYLVYTRVFCGNSTC